jgi:hypothetical protein
MSSENDPKQSPEKRPSPGGRPWDPKRDPPAPIAGGPGDNPFIGPDGKPLTGAALEEAKAREAAKRASGG